jgi:hypothetical protein
VGQGDGGGLGNHVAAEQCVPGSYHDQPVPLVVLLHDCG